MVQIRRHTESSTLELVEVAKIFVNVMLMDHWNGHHNKLNCNECPY